MSQWQRTTLVVLGAAFALSTVAANLALAGCLMTMQQQMTAQEIRLRKMEAWRDLLRERGHEVPDDD